MFSKILRSVIIMGKTNRQTNQSLYLKIATKIVVFAVAANGIIFVIDTLLSDLVRNHHARNGEFNIGFSLIIGLTLIYLSRLLSKNKRTAWVVALPIYAIVFAFNIYSEFIRHHHHLNLNWYSLTRDFILPVIIVIGLIILRKQFNVRSDLRSFRSSLRFIVLILLITLGYGVVGFQLLDDHDFHQEISIPGAIQRTIDQFDLTTNAPLVAYTDRARVFLDSLSIVSIGAVSYGIISLFSPIKARFVDQSNNRRIMKQLLESYPANSEDFFKLWPHDKAYFFHHSVKAGLAFHVRHGVALVVGDPAGSKVYFPSLLKEFDELCYVNDWTPAFIHTEPKYSQLYLDDGLSLQKIGEEAVLQTGHFLERVATNKYFRNINSKFTKAGYTTSLLQPPHDPKTLARMQQISKEWLSVPGRDERSFMMGYFSTAYLQQCPVLVALDPHGVIQGFLNQIPTFDKDEANFDMLRNADGSLGNINDFILMSFIKSAHEQGYERVNLGLCPLSGLDEAGADRTIIDDALKFAYNRAGKLYSFSGLRKFKEKYEPSWNSRFVTYSGGIPGFTKTINSLNSVWKVRLHL